MRIVRWRKILTGVAALRDREKEKLRPQSGQSQAGVAAYAEAGRERYGVNNAVPAWPPWAIAGTAALYAISSPRMVPVAEANLSVSRPRRCSIETKRFGSG